MGDRPPSSPSPREGTRRGPRGGPQGYHRIRLALSRRRRFPIVAASTPPLPTLRETAMSEILDVLLLLALPASGKSEVRRYLASLSPEQCRGDFHLGPTVQLDDYPYVHMM